MRRWNAHCRRLRDDLATWVEDIFKEKSNERDRADALWHPGEAKENPPLY